MLTVSGCEHSLTLDCSRGDPAAFHNSFYDIDGALFDSSGRSARIVFPPTIPMKTKLHAREDRDRRIQRCETPCLAAADRESNVVAYTAYRTRENRDAPHMRGQPKGTIKNAKPSKRDETVLRTVISVRRNAAVPRGSDAFLLNPYTFAIV